MNANKRAAVERGLVIISSRGVGLASGFYIGNGFLITNCHCLPRTPDPREQDDMVVVTVKTLATRSKSAKAAAIYADPCGDIAVLGPLDEQAFSHEADKYRTLIEKLPPVKINVRALSRLTKFRVHVRSVKGKWLSGQAFVAGYEGRTLTVQLEDKKARIPGGTSGSPVVNDDGLAVGVLKIGAETSAEYSALALPDYLPMWLLDRIKSGLNIKRPR
jgi:V8-like Glu-specific endopeptidase